MEAIEYPALVIHSAFVTLQGEGPNAGRPALFVRLAGCNIWSGREKTREADAVKGGCALWCDTQFVGGKRVSLDVFLPYLSTVPGFDSLFEHAGGDGKPLLVLTGGEPLLQIERIVRWAGPCASVRWETVRGVFEKMDRAFDVEVETNGVLTEKVLYPGSPLNSVFGDLILSPKFPSMFTVPKTSVGYHALKITESMLAGETPADAALDLRRICENVIRTNGPTYRQNKLHVFVQPVEYVESAEKTAASMRRAVEIVKAFTMGPSGPFTLGRNVHPPRLGLQLHKYANIP